MIKRRYVDCRDGQIHLREAGPAGAPVIVFFHQTASSGVMFEKVIARLEDRYHCVSLDSPGFGQSYQPEAIPDMAFVADRLLEAVTGLGIDRFHACGHHTGGCAAIEMPDRDPGRLLSLTLIGPVLVNDLERVEYRKTFVEPFKVEPSGAFLNTAWAYLDMLGTSDDVELQRREMVDHLIAHRAMPMAFTAVWNQDVEAKFRAIAIPLHVMCAREDVLWPMFERAATMRPDAWRTEVGGADFEPDRDPVGVANGLAAFLATLPH